MMAVGSSPLNINIKLIANISEGGAEQHRVIVHTNHHDTVAKGSDLKKHTAPCRSSLILGAKQLSQVIAREIVNAAKHILVTTNSRLIHRAPQINSHHIEAGRGIVVPGGLPADVGSSRLGQRAASTKLERLKHTTLRHAGNLHSSQTPNPIIMQVAQSTVDHRFGISGTAGSSDERGGTRKLTRQPEEAIITEQREFRSTRKAHKATSRVKHYRTAMVDRLPYTENTREHSTSFGQEMRGDFHLTNNGRDIYIVPPESVVTMMGQFPSPVTSTSTPLM